MFDILGEMNARLWKIGTRRAMAYVEGKENALRVMEAAGLELELRCAMGVYTDRRGRAFAWLIAFDARRWEEVSALLPTMS